MKILHVINSLGLGGAEKLIEETIPRLSERNDFEIEVLLLSNRQNVFEEKLKKQGISIKVSPHKNIRNPLNIIFMRKMFLKGNYDIVHAHLFPVLYFVFLSTFLLKTKTKFIYTEHSTHNKRREIPICRIIEKVIYGRFDKVVCISSKVKEKLEKWLNFKGKNQDKFVIIENGIDIENFKNSQSYKPCYLVPEYEGNYKLICMVGRFSEQKDQLTLIRSMLHLDNNVHLLLVGEGEKKDSSVLLVQKLNLESRVHFLGFREDVNRIIKTSDIVVLSSIWEGFGLAALEGMACRKPTIGTRVEGLMEVIGEQEMLFEVGNSQELADKIRILLNDEELYEKFAVIAEKNSEKYDINSFVQNSLDLYLSIVNS
ncbi:MAG: glycosyltransferase [Streptococcaceae bacterium]|jgi:glycosyltransferase involved in cell wall biosynthesis|nr:glycosyltransferase [Streptococcaceae bacterium]